MDVYLPIAELSVNAFGIILLGFATGILSGLFGIGGGFLTTPLLMFIGVPPAVAVSSSANQIIASSTSGFISHWRRKRVDFIMGLYLLMGGILGSSLGVWIFSALQGNGHIDLVISLCYLFLLGGVGIFMARQSFKEFSKQSDLSGSFFKDRFAYWQGRLPWQTEFLHSNITVSALLPFSIGAMVGVVVSIMGIGGGFLLIPAMMYILGMPASVVVGTSLFQIIFITANVTFLQAVTTHTVDVTLALLLLLGSVFGAQAGTRMSIKISPAKLNALLAILVLLVTLKLAFSLFATPDSLYSVTIEP